MAITITLTDHQAEGLDELLDLALRGREDFQYQAQRGDYSEADERAAEARWTLAESAAKALKTQHAGAPHPVVTAVEEWATVAVTIDTENVWEHFTCVEIEAIAQVSRAACRPDVAAQMIELHAVCDDEFDLHHSTSE